MSFAKVLSAVAFAAVGVQVSFGSLPSNTDFDFVDAYADLTNLMGVSSRTRVKFFVKGTSGGVVTTLREYGPFAPTSGGIRLGQLPSQPGVTYSLWAAVVTGPADPLTTITAGLVGSDEAVNGPITLATQTIPLVSGSEVTVADASAVHDQWNFRVDLNDAKYPWTTFKFYAVITSGGLTINALIKTASYTKPTVTEGFQPFSLNHIGTDRVVITATARDSRAVSTNAISATVALIGIDANLDGNAPQPASLAQATWFIDPITGNDDWDGTAAVHVAGTSIGPIARASEYLRRTGLNRAIAIAVQINIMNDLPAGDPLILTGTITVKGARITVTGYGLAQIITGTIDAYTAPVAATNTLAIVNDLAVADWTPYAGKLFRMTSGPRAAQFGSCWIDKDLGGGASNARVSTPCYKADAFYNVTVFAPSAGESYEVVAPRLLGGGLFTDVVADDQGGLFIEFCATPAFFSAGVMNSQMTATCYFKCLFTNSFVVTAGRLIQCQDCQYFGFGSVVGGNLVMSGGFWNAIAWGFGAGGTMYNTFVPILIEAGSMLTGGNQETGFSTIYGRSGGDFQMSATTNYWSIQSGTQLVLRGATSIYGEVVTGTAYIIGVGSQMLMGASSSINIGGTVNDITVANKTQIFPYDAATGLPQPAVQTCSLANFVAAGLFNGNIHDPFTGVRVLSGLV